MPLAPSPARNVSRRRPRPGRELAERLLHGERLGRRQFVQPRALVQDGRRGRAGTDRVRRYPGAPQLHGEGADESGHPGLGGAVGGQHGQPPGRGGGGDGEEAPVPRFGAAQQRGHGHPGEVQHPAEVDVEHGLVLAGRRPRRGRHRRSPRRPRGRRPVLPSAVRSLRPPPRGRLRHGCPPRRWSHPACVRRHLLQLGTRPSGYGRAGSSAQRSTAMTRHPAAASAATVADPIPRAAPATKATRGAPLGPGGGSAAGLPVPPWAAPQERGYRPGRGHRRADRAALVRVNHRTTSARTRAGPPAGRRTRPPPPRRTPRPGPRARR